MNSTKKKLVLCSLLLAGVHGQMAAAETKKTRSTLVNIHTLYYGSRFALNASLGFFALGQSSYHLGNILTDSWLEQQFRDSPGYKQAIRFCVGLVGTGILLGLVNCLDHFGYVNTAGNIEAGLAETESTVDGTAQPRQPADSAEMD